MATANRLRSSFRDPSGFMFESAGRLYRQVNGSWRENYALLAASGLYRELTERGLLVRHAETELPCPEPGGFAVLAPETVPLVSYPYEWCFSQLKAAALLTLEIQRLALARGLRLKDASAYNVQFRGSVPVFIDTLSFEKNEPGPWPAYAQFCRHFLAPLALAARRDPRLQRLSVAFIDGLPLDLVSALLPAGTLFSPGLLAHLHLHSRSGALEKLPGGEVRVEALLEGLEDAVRSLKFAAPGSGWAGYKPEESYAPAARAAKLAFVAAALDELRPASVWDLGANTGEFSRLASGRGIYTAALDADPAAVEKNYLAAAAERDACLLPLVMDLRSPSPGAGWANAERGPLTARGRPGCVLALALTHHLALGAGVPFAEQAAYFASLGGDLVAEFVPKDDPRSAQLLAGRADVFSGYGREAFEAAFFARYEPVRSEPLPGSGRVMYLLRGRRA